MEAIAAAGVDTLLTDLLAGGRPVSRFVVRNLRGDWIETSEATADPGELPSLLIRRRLILEALAQRLGPAGMRCGAALVRCSQDADGVEAHFEDGSSWSGDLLVGADDAFCREGAFFVYARGRGVYANVFDLGPDERGIPQTHWGFFQEEVLPAERQERRRLLQEPVPPEGLAKLPADLAALIRATPAEAQVANWSYDIDPLPSLVLGRVALVGDAGHAMSSSQARGMTAGLEDAVALAHQLALSASGSVTREAAA